MHLRTTLGGLSGAKNSGAENAPAEDDYDFFFVATRRAILKLVSAARDHSVKISQSVPVSTTVLGCPYL